jgi:hypothetical protein
VKTLRERAERWVLLDMAKALGEYPSEIGEPDEECVQAWLAGHRARRSEKKKKKPIPKSRRAR